MNDQIDAAIAKVKEPKPETRVNLQLGLADGRICVLNLPLPLSADEVIQLIVNLPTFIAQANVQATSGRGIALPNGQVVPVMPAQPAKES